MGVLDWLKKKITGSSSSSTSKKIKEANRTSYYGGGVSTKATQTTVKASTSAAKAKKKKEEKKEQEKKQEQISSAFKSSAFKATTEKTKKIAQTKGASESEKPDAFNRKNAFKTTGLPQTRQQKLQSQMQSDIDKKLNAPQSTVKSTVKATPPTIKHRSTAMGTLGIEDTKKRIAKMNVEKIQQRERSRAADKLKPKIDEKYSTRKSGAPAYVKQGNLAADPDVAKYNVLKHPYATSGTRGALSGTTFGLSELAINKLSKGEAKEAEKFYQANKSKGAETLGELAGGLLSYGGTAKGFEKLGERAVARTAETKLGKKLGAEALARTMAGKGAKAALARSLVGDTIQDSTVGLVDTMSDVATRDDLKTPKDYLKAIAKGQAANYGMGLAGNVVANGAAREALGELVGNGKRARVEPPRVTPKVGESIDDIVKRYPDIEDKYLDYDGTTAAVNRYFDPDATAEAAVDRYHDLDILRDKKATSGDYKVSLNRKRKTDVSLPNERGIETAPKTKRQKLTPEEKYERMVSRADENADAIRAELGAESPTPVKERITKPADVEKEYTVQLTRENGRHQTVKVEATTEKEALDKAIGRKQGVKNARMLGSTEVQPKAELPNTKAATKSEPKVVEDLGTIVNRKKEKTTYRERFHEFSSSLKTKISNSLDAFEAENKKFLRSDPEKWKTNNAAINNVRLSQGKAGASINDAHLAADGTRITGSHKAIINGKEHTIEHGKSLMQIFDGMDKDTETKFNEYLLLKHSPDRADAGKPLFDKMNLPDGRSYNDREACEELANKILEDNPEFAVKAEEVYQYLREELQNRVDKGLIKQDVVDEWSKKYPFYVPTGRDGDFSGEKDIWDLLGQLKKEGNTVGAGGIEKAVGSDLPVRSIKEQLAEATSRNWRDITMNDLFKQMFGEKVGKELAQDADGGIERVLDNTINLSKSKGGKYYAEVFDGGEMRRVEIEKRFYDAIEDMYKNGFGNPLFDVPNEAFSKVSRFFKNVITTWNPIFMVKNGMRDFPEAVINSRQTKEFLQIAASGDAWREIHNGGEYWQALKDSGVLQTNFINLEEALTKGDNVLKRGFDKFARLQEAVETNPRLVEYMATIKKAGYDLDTGLPKDVVDAIKKDFDYDLGKGLADFRKGKKDIPDEIVKAVKDMGYDAKAGIGNVPTRVRDIAAANASDVTVNFSRSGSIGKAINKGFVPFFNPSVQGWSKFVRNISEQPSGKALLSMLVKATALGSGATVLNNYLWGDNKNYQQISARDKATNYIVPLPVKLEDGKFKYVNTDDAEVFIKIPKSRFAAVYSLPTVNINNDNKMGGDRLISRWAEMIKVAGDQVAPVDPVESNLLAPLLLAHKNETWYGTPIVSEGIRNDTNPSQEYDANTSWFGKQLGKATENLPTELQISPKKADYIIDAETGVFGDFLLPMATPSRQSGDKNVVVRGLKSAGNVVKRQFTIDSVTQNDLSTRFYKEVQEAADNSKVAKGTKEDKKNKEESKRLNGYSTEIGKINTAIRTLQNGNRKTKQEDIYGLQKVRNQMMQDAIDGKAVPSEYKAMDAVQKYVGTAYAVNHFGTSADKRAMKLYGAKKYGTLSAAEQRKAINADKDFYKGVQSIGKLQAKMQKAGITSDTTLSRAIALASVDASDDLFGAYKAQDQSRTETAHEMNRARTYFKNGGSTDEFVKLEKCRKTVGKLPEDQRKDELKKLDDEFAKGKMSYAEYDKREAEINYNADISYIGLSTSLAQANSPERGYRVYDIKDKNIQKGINLAAMGYTARDYRKMSKELDAQGDNNGYPKKQEIIDYLNKGNFKDKATLFEALYYYKGKYNPFGTPTKYTRAQAAAEGKKKKVEWITDETDDINVKEEASSGGYYRRGWGRWHRWGWGHRGGSNRSQVKISPFKPSAVHPSEGGSSAKVPKTSVSVKSTSRAGSGASSVNAGISTKATMPKASATPKVSIPTTRRSGVSGGGSRSGRVTTSTPPTVKARTTGGTPTSTRARSASSTGKTLTSAKTRRASSTGSAINSAKSHRATATSTKARGTTSTARVSSNIKRSQARMRSGSKMDITPLNIKPVKANKSTKGYNSNLSAALKDIENTQKKVAPPKARRK